MNTCWFLGANTAEGFCSRFEQLHPDGRVRKCVIIKGGPGYGKSTFMKQLRKAAESLGADTESYPCSSDPASLDGLFIPTLGLAFVDGTAPHAAATEKENRRGSAPVLSYSGDFSCPVSRRAFSRLQTALYMARPSALTARVTTNTTAANP